MLSACLSSDIHHYRDSKPELDIKAYFDGHIKAWGVVQDWRGRVVSRFDVNIIGEWDGANGTLTEDFVYYDEAGSTQRRIWSIEQLEDGTYRGTAGDILGEASGKQAGSAVNWAYVMDVPVGDTSHRLKFDDWMWLMNDEVLINRSYLRKFGLKVAEVTIFMKKETI